jgi:hypothetical protein
MDYVTIAGELESKSNLFIRYIKSSTIPTDEKIIKPMEPPNAIRGLSAACKLLIYLIFMSNFTSSIYKISSSKYTGSCSCCLSTSFIGQCRCIKIITTNFRSNNNNIETIYSIN